LIGRFSLGSFHRPAAKLLNKLLHHFLGFFALFSPFSSFLFLFLFFVVVVLITTKFVMMARVGHDFMAELTFRRVGVEKMRENDNKSQIGHNFNKMAEN